MTYRADILAAVKESPGISLRGVARAVDVALSTAKHHLSALEDDGELICLRHTDGLRVKAHHFFTVDAINGEVWRRAIASMDRERRRINTRHQNTEREWARIEKLKERYA